MTCRQRLRAQLTAASSMSSFAFTKLSHVATPSTHFVCQAARRASEANSTDIPLTQQREACTHEEEVSLRQAALDAAHDELGVPWSWKSQLKRGFLHLLAGSRRAFQSLRGIAQRTAIHPQRRQDQVLDSACVSASTRLRCLLTIAKAL